ncbi:hypothetical protein DB35_18100 [Streptomyces abyssalis]|uniref:Uncharacterized protein n=2 Tax=Streptomyces abyssalis TaxID=933944 RepID=A0A1E7JKV3_9ACTN|nr:hypothetical protein AN215_19255 [Streptomyces abyssalis]OEU91148.1 hypothetical protein DB35_18100 [Streptomyces abyssalis]
MDQLLGDCAHMARHWTVPACDPALDLHSPWAPRPGRHPQDGPGGTAVAPASYEALRGVRVPAASARILEGMSEYGVW